MVSKLVGNPQDVRTHVDSTALRRTEKLKSDDEAKGSAGAPTKDYAINLSPEAVELAQAREKALSIAKSTSDVREDRIAALKEKIASGQYRVDSGKIADGMLMEAIRDELAKNPIDLG
ncbi:MAG: flagellar biosynthesis anti-sigma factor FlgM [Oligoflexus sp.]